VYKFLLVGSPNSGKTTIFNALTGERERVGNWHGVTAQGKKGVYISKKCEFEVVDLPGIYSLQAYSLEEKVTVDAILNDSYTAIILVIDATSKNVGLKLLKELICINKKVILLVNKIGLVEIDEKTKRNLNENFLAINPYSKKNVKEIAEKICKLLFIENEISLESIREKKQKNYDKFLLNPFILFPIFFAFLALSFIFSFNKYLGGGISNILMRGVNSLGGIISTCGDSFFTLVLSKTILGLEGVVGLIPQVVIFQFFMFLLEESGLFCRFCVVTFKLVNKFSLSGKSLFPLISALGCGAVSCKLCNSCENSKIKLNTLKLIAFVPCSAKNSLIIFICLKVFPKPILALILVYLCWFVISFGYLVLFCAKKGNNEQMFIDLVRVNFPNVKLILNKVFLSTTDFFKKIISTCLVISLGLAIFTSVTVRFSLTENIEDSLICFLCKKSSFILSPLGLGDWKIVLSLVMGLFAKEGVISSISFLYPQGLIVAKSGAIVLLFIILSYSPCLTNIVAYNKERKFLGYKIFLKHNFFAYFGGFYLNMLLTKPFIFCIITIIIVGVYILYERIYLSRKLKTHASSN